MDTIRIVENILTVSGFYGNVCVCACFYTIRSGTGPIIIFTLLGFVRLRYNTNYLYIELILQLPGIYITITLYYI